MLDAWIESALLVDAILGLLLLEVAGVVLLRSLLGVGPRLQEVAGTLWAGAFLVLALRFALVDPRPLAIAACLGLAFLGHLFDLAQRFRRPRPGLRR